VDAGADPTQRRRVRLSSRQRTPNANRPGPDRARRRTLRPHRKRVSFGSISQGMARVPRVAEVLAQPGNRGPGSVHDSGDRHPVDDLARTRLSTVDHTELDHRLRGSRRSRLLGHGLPRHAARLLAGRKIGRIFSCHLRRACSFAELAGCPIRARDHTGFHLPIARVDDAPAWPRAGEIAALSRRRRVELRNADRADGARRLPPALPPGGPAARSPGGRLAGGRGAALPRLGSGRTRTSAAGGRLRPLLGETTDRILFFRSADAPKMPGSAAT